MCMIFHKKIFQCVTAPIPLFQIPQKIGLLILTAFGDSIKLTFFMNYKLKKLAYHIASWNIKPKYIQGVFINTFITVNLKKLLNKKGKKFESPFKVSFKTHAL